MTEGEEEAAMQEGEQAKGECEWAPNSSMHLPLSLYVPLSLCDAAARGARSHNRLGF